jgi:hypothetical protein
MPPGTVKGTTARNQSADVFATDITVNCRDIDEQCPRIENQLSGRCRRVCISGVAVLR